MVAQTLRRERAFIGKRFILIQRLLALCQTNAAALLSQKSQNEPCTPSRTKRMYLNLKFTSYVDSIVNSVASHILRPDNVQFVADVRPLLLLKLVETKAK